VALNQVQMLGDDFAAQQALELLGVEGTAYGLA
jgi:hypothetical protein